ncbi:benzoate-CoA ligase family protein [uncultured Tateyamaria sp.]|uniref:benzoate-CoA ligase family protein n=1 Tax=uncultured Tateyamaria sp. TaxID=455651 RepID=UPI00260A92A4|nr:benzoate-CoA ligase family protein [uncultured Tateyamaria sp.]
MANAATYFVDRHVAEGRSDHVAFREAGTGRSLTYGALAEHSGRAAAALLALGVRPEERMAMLVLDQIEFPVLFWGALKAGVIAVPLNTLLAAPVYDSILRDSRATVLVVSQLLYAGVAPVLADNPYLKHVIVIGDKDGDHTIAYDAFMAGGDTVLPAFDASPDETAFWLYSSGSTGQPKGVHHVHSAMQATAETYGAQVLGIQPDDVIFSAAKFFFAYGLGNAMTFPMSVGATAIIYAGRPTPDVVYDIIKTEKPTIFCGVPTLYAALVAHIEAVGAPDSPLRLCISAGEALPENVGTRWRTAIGVDILDGVGSTEMLHIFLSNAPGDVVYGTSGVAVPGYELRLVDEAGQDVGVDEVGELLVNGASAAGGYWNKREKSRQTFEGVWTRTGDKYERRADGRYVYCGRTDDMFKVSGIWVSPFEVEQAISSHASVLECAVVAAQDDDGLNKPKAFVVVHGDRPDDLEDQLRDHVKDRIGKWKYPRWIECVESLPKTATGKIQRFKLRRDA